MQIKFVIIGGLGYIGQVLQEELKKKNYDFEIIDNDLMRLHNWPNKLDIINDDHLAEINNIIKDSDVVVNLAAIVGDEACLVDTKKAIEINCQGIQNIVNICNKFNKKLIHASTCSIYGYSNELLIESSQTFPVDFYGQTKYQQERQILENSDNFCILRYGTAYGWSPRMRFDLVVNVFVAKVFNGEKMVVFGGDQWRPFSHIRDNARAIIFAAEKDLKGIFNLSNENVKIKDLAYKIANEKVPVEINDLQTDPRNYKVDSSKLLNEGFIFEWNILKGVEEMNQKTKELEKYNSPQYSNYKLLVLSKL